MFFNYEKTLYYCGFFFQPVVFVSIDSYQSTTENHVCHCSLFGQTVHITTDLAGSFIHMRLRLPGLYSLDAPLYKGMARMKYLVETGRTCVLKLRRRSLGPRVTASKR